MNIARLASSTDNIASMHEVVMKKEALITHLEQNKAKHDVILAAAIVGYWDTAKSKLEDKQKQLVTQVEEYKADVETAINKVVAKVEAKETLPNSIAVRAIAIDLGLGLVYPQDHSKDYDRAISMMRSSVYDEVRLSVDEYDAYVLNNWEWKNNFINSNSFYVTNAMTKQLYARSNVTGCYQVSAYDNLAVSGCSTF
jgi:hypothetical protein